jgi:alpha-methylacyl-CoA racemase
MVDLSLHGICVLDLTRLAPGPYASLILADLGAEVIKVEEPKCGDPLRYPVSAEDDGRTTLFQLLNRNKKSLTLNLKAPRGKRIFLELVHRADVLVEGFRPGVMARLGLDYDALERVNPRLVYASVSGYGPTGPYAERACHDVNCLALSGYLDVTGARDGPPAMSAVPVADMAAGLWTALGIVAALLGRERSGRGQQVEMPMLDSVAALLAVPFADLLATGRPPQRGTAWLGGRLACYNLYETADGLYMSIGALEPQFWASFCRAVGHQEWVARQYAPDQSSLKHELAALFRSEPRAHWVTLLATCDCCCEPVLALDEALAHPQAEHRGLLREGWLRTPVARGDVPAMPAPGLGQHTNTVLARLGYSADDCSLLRESGVV